MKIFTQNRKYLVKMPRNIWAANYGNRAGIFCSDSSVSHLGEYRKGRALEVLEEITEAYQNGESVFYMPQY